MDSTAHDTTPDERAPERTTDLADRIASDPELAASFDMVIGPAVIVARPVIQPGFDNWRPDRQWIRRMYLREWDVEDLGVADKVIIDNPSIGLGELTWTFDSHRAQRGVKTGFARYQTAEEEANLERLIARAKASVAQAKSARRRARTARCGRR